MVSLNEGSLFLREAYQYQLIKHEQMDDFIEKTKIMANNEALFISMRTVFVRELLPTWLYRKNPISIIKFLCRKYSTLTILENVPNYGLKASSYSPVENPSFIVVSYSNITSPRQSHGILQVQRVFIFHQ